MSFRLEFHFRFLHKWGTKKERKSWFSENRNKVIVLRLSFTTNTRYSWNLLFLIMCILKEAFCFMDQIICSYNYLLWTIHKKSKFLTFWPTFNQIKSDIFKEQMIWPYVLLEISFPMKNIIYSVCTTYMNVFFMFIQEYIMKCW